MENQLIIFGFKKHPLSRSFVPVCDIIHEEFKDSTVIIQHSSKEKTICQIYHVDENGFEYQIRIIISYLDDAVTILAEEASYAVRAYQAVTAAIRELKDR